MVTRLIIVRHAKPLSEGYAEDGLRPLSEEGRKIQKKMTEQLLSEGIEMHQVYSSPLLRAQQTAEIIANYYELDVKEEVALGVEFDSLQLLQKIKPNQTTAFVGHAPTLGEFIDALVGDKVLPYGLSTSGTVIVDFDGPIQFGAGTFVSYLKP